MPPRKKQPLCEIIFGQLRIPVFDKEKGMKVIEGIFMIGETGEAEAKPRGRKRGRRKAKRAKAEPKGKRVGKEKRIKRISKLKEKGMNPAEIAKKVGVSPMTVARDMKEMKKE
jgi:DNA invertase Pin-like site-specific DNA recombinase